MTQLNDLLDIYDTCDSLNLTEQEKIDIISDTIEQVDIESDRKEILVRNLNGNKVLYFDAMLADIFNDSQYKIDEELLKKLNIDEDGDLDHNSVLNSDFSFKGLFKKIASKVEDGALYLRFMLNKEHKDFDKFVSKIKQKDINDIKLSAEFYNFKSDGNKILNADGIGWSVLLDEQAGNDYARVYDVNIL